MSGREDGTLAGTGDETSVQLFGTGGRSDLLPGMIYSKIAHDLCSCSEAAIAVNLEFLRQHAEPAGPSALTSEQRHAFDQLRAEFEGAAKTPLGLECKLLKLAESFDTLPAAEWTELRVGGTAERFLVLSKLNGQQEIVQIRGPATEWFCQMSERAGSMLPSWTPDIPVLFDDPKLGLSGPRPVLTGDASERWIRFVFTTIKQHSPKSIQIIWGTPMGPISYGFATLDTSLCSASVLAIDLARFTSAAALEAKQGRETCSPFTLPSLAERGFRWAEEALPPSPPQNYTLGQLVDDLRRFGEDYCIAETQIREQNPIIAKHSWIQLAANVSEARVHLLATPGFAELRDWARSEWNDDISVASSRRMMDVLIQRSNDGLCRNDIEDLSLAETVILLKEPIELWDKVLPERLKRRQATRQAELSSGQVAARKRERLHIDDSC